MWVRGHCILSLLHQINNMHINPWFWRFSLFCYEPVQHIYFCWIIVQHCVQCKVSIYGSYLWPQPRVHSPIFGRLYNQTWSGGYGQRNTNRTASMSYSWQTTLWWHVSTTVFRISIVIWSLLNKIWKYVVKSNDIFLVKSFIEHVIQEYSFILVWWNWWKFNLKCLINSHIPVYKLYSYPIYIVKMCL